MADAPSLPPLAEPAPVLPYATGIQYQYDALAWQAGRFLVVRRDVTLPPLCVKCNRPADGRPWSKTLYWHHPGFTVIVLFNVIIYLIVAACVRKSARVRASLCAEHRVRRRVARRAAWGCGLVAVAAVSGMIAVAVNRAKDDPLLPPLGLLAVALGMLVFAAVFSRKGRVLLPRKVDANFAWLDGAGPEFLANFPPFPSMAAR